MAFVERFYIALPQHVMFFVFKNGLPPKSIHWAVVPLDKRALDLALAAYSSCHIYDDLALFDIDTHVAIATGTRFRASDATTYAAASVHYSAMIGAQLQFDGKVRTYTNPYLDITETIKER